MPTLSEILAAAREDDDYRRTRLLADNDYKLMAELVLIRKRSGLKQSDVAERLGISQQAVSKIESYDSDPKLSTIRMYANAIGALVDHTVAQDVGQLSEGSGWVAVAYTVPRATFIAAPSSYRSTISARADFSLAA
ncbi:helix-turn-helix domain-containing protein [Leifsonia aquatica]|uniref:helix-turn-helix domain-containing protein n=1 Tax=Leifsonia aquatica TaxID=144185 RepID=UPI0028AA8A50|nr:helix-turn-helix transcriptional regulator [Leifsonia aquatica]